MALEFGFFVGRPFHIVSELPSRRYLDIVNKKPVIKIDNGRDSQKWTFNWATRSIQSMSTGSLALTMNAKKNNLLTVAKSRSQWFNIFKFSEGFIENTSREFVLNV
jgi:DNA-binding HxlR family transcriptional regulator